MDDIKHPARAVASAPWMMHSTNEPPTTHQFCNRGWDWLGRSRGEILVKGKMPSLWSHALLVIDIVSMKVFVRALGAVFAWAVDPNGGVLDSHLFFYDRYSDLAEYHRLKGRTAKADRLAAVAEAFYQAAPDDDEPPQAAAMAMPVPRPPVITNAVSTIRLPKPRTERPSDLAPSPAP